MNRENKIYLIKGKDIIKMTLDILESMGPDIGKDKSKLIGIKPNLVCASRASQGATTHPEIVEGIIIYLKNNGYNNIVVAESSWVGANTEDAADFCGYTQLCAKYGIQFVNIKNTNPVKAQKDGFELYVSEYVNKIGYLINVPLIKGHCQTDITCALKNMKGLIPDAEKRRYHRIGLHQPIAYLNTVIKQDLIIADAICPDPYFEEGGRPHQMDMIAGAFDPVLMDSYAATVLGYEPFDIEYIMLANNLGVGKVMDKKTEIIHIGDKTAISEISQPEKKYLNLIEEDNACSACHSHLVAALEQLKKEGLVNQFAENICIGQGYRGEKGMIGVGDCTSEFSYCRLGCPPSSGDIEAFLRDLIKQGKI